jgi:urocanate hydratase
LAHDPHAWTGYTFSLETFKFYCGLTQASHSDRQPDQDPGLGGKLLWAGELDESGRALVVAGNIAGAATLTATADVNAQKRAVREAIVDFLVTSLDEALRILKNEIRKRQTVAVCVGAAPDLMEREISERGVQPDLYRRDIIAAAERPSKPGELDPRGDRALVIWRVHAGPQVVLPKLDAIAIDCLASADEFARRWIRLSPRYIGRLEHGVHLLIGNPGFAVRFVERVGEQFRRGEIRFEGQIQVSYPDRNEEYCFPPGQMNEEI